MLRQAVSEACRRRGHRLTAVASPGSPDHLAVAATETVYGKDSAHGPPALTICPH